MRTLRFICLSKLNRRSSARALLLFALCATTAIPLYAQTFTTLQSFNSTDANPYSALIQTTNGNLYGTTSGVQHSGNGTAFQITPSGALTTLLPFGVGGKYPYAALVQATNGNLYGTTWEGGAKGNGTVFQMTPGGILTTLHSFDFTDGAFTLAGLVQAANGNLYGTTSGGGAEYGYGTVFEITPGGTLTTLHTFEYTDGAYPYAGLVQATDGNLYGTTEGGGDIGAGTGTVFKITPSGTLTTLHSFNGNDGSYVFAGLIQANDGNFYGTTYAGGPNNAACYFGSCGTVFKITPSGTLTTLYSFCSQSGCTDGSSPYAELVQATNGNLYGTTYQGGANNAGTVFQITPSGTLTTLYSFCSQSACADGKYTYAGLVQATNGVFYGSTYEGGTSDTCTPAPGCGTLFSLSLGLGPFVETQTTSGEAGAAVKILGTDLTGATNVSFNGAAAVFELSAGSLITTTVPAGATTGFVTVTLPRGTLRSTKKFVVMP
jgi:uncharacterized repeat protein (TIGR03803 family)